MNPEYFLTCLIIVATPGTGVVITLAAALSGGRRDGLIAAFGCTLGILPHIVAVIGGVAAILHASAMLFALLKYLGVAYLFYMAWMAIRDRDLIVIRPETMPRRAGAIVVHAVLANLLNPKLTMFFFAFLPQFVDASEPHPLAAMLGLSAIFMAMTFAIFAIYGLLAASVRHQLATRPAILVWMRRTFAAAFVGLGLKLALAER